MQNIIGKHNTAKVFTDILDSVTRDQIEVLLDQEFVANSQIRIMPDTHAGKGCVIGTTMTVEDRVVPNLVGVDIGCFSGDTLIPLLDGSQKTLKEMYKSGGEYWVYSIDENNKIIAGKAIAKQTRKLSSLIKVIVSGGNQIICTPDHEFLLRGGSYKKAVDLEYKDSLMPLYRTYQTRDGYESLLQPEKDMKSRPTHLCVAEQFYGKIPDGYVVHHKDFNQFNNTPENLDIITKEEHSSIHASLDKNVKRLKSDEFKNKRIKKLNESGFYHKDLYEIKKKIGTKNITDYMIENLDHFKESVRDNGNRGKKYLIDYNKSEKGRNKSKELANKLYKCDICGIEVKSQIGIYNHNRKYHNNHKIISVENLNYKEDVYCLTVERYHNFALASGVFVHNCGMYVSNLGKIEIDRPSLDRFITHKIPHGKNNNKELQANFQDQINKLFCLRDLSKQASTFNLAVGSLGGGNHFIELDVDDEGNVYLVIHSGSRNLGLQVAKHYQKMAIKYYHGQSDDYLAIRKNLIASYKKHGRQSELQGALAGLSKSFSGESGKSIPDDLCYLEGSMTLDYFHDLKIAQEYAKLNRETMAKNILNFLGITPTSQFHTVHNYIDLDNMILRKGAVSAQDNELLIIPINMRDGSILAYGKGNEDWNYSAPHGAGRLMSRTQANATFTMDDFRSSMEGIYSTSVRESTLDESPFAYKSMDEIIDNIGDTVEIYKIIRPIYNFKA